MSALQAIRHLLWDVDPANVDLRKHRVFLISRILRFGTPADIRWLLETYSDAEIIATVKTSRGLDRKTATFWSVHYGIPAEEIQCFRMPLLQDCSV